ncbi:1439_t:CDS:2 [Diversispora eburnea]|uniref:1439_t:CDS:1 n=1 Tax=Diversispora eburnea TaxID=1213867 RepID=A0A9N8V7U4_9GLOM|nr:1439_t:CDS:2 [Diversispora eburnea]
MSMNPCNHRIIVPDCNQKLFEKIALSNSRLAQMNLIEDGELLGKFATGVVPTEIWGIFGGSQISPDSSVVLSWDAFQSNSEPGGYPQIAPNFIIE